MTPTMLVRVACVLCVTSALTLQPPKARLRALLAPVRDELFCDPVTKVPLERTVRLDGAPPVYRGGAGRVYATRDGYLDLVAERRSPASARELASGVVDSVKATAAKSPAERVRMDTFQSPLVSFLYERGWRDSFKASGFPGVADEFVEVRDFFDDAFAAREAGVIVDLCCGTGLMARRINAAAAPGARVVAADYSPSMLAETRRRDASLELARVDVARLPFQSRSVDAVHAGAAMHCWVDVEAGLAEVARALKPGGARCWNQSLVDGRPGISSEPSTSLKSNSLSMILEPLILASRVLDD